MGLIEEPLLPDATDSAEPGPELMKAILLGLSQGDYQEVASQFVDEIGRAS